MQWADDSGAHTFTSHGGTGSRPQGPAVCSKGGKKRLYLNTRCARNKAQKSRSNVPSSFHCPYAYRLGPMTSNSRKTKYCRGTVRLTMPPLPIPSFLSKNYICLFRTLEQKKLKRSIMLSLRRLDSSTEQPRQTGKAWHKSHFNSSKHYLDLSNYRNSINLR